MKCKGFNIALPSLRVVSLEAHAGCCCLSAWIYSKTMAEEIINLKYKPVDEVNELFDLFLLLAACKLCDRAGGEM